MRGGWRLGLWGGRREGGGRRGRRGSFFAVLGDEGNRALVELEFLEVIELLAFVGESVPDFFEEEIEITHQERVDGETAKISGDESGGALMIEDGESVLDA